jgi:long-chain fatty acid transport protein
MAHTPIMMVPDESRRMRSGNLLRLLALAVASFSSGQVLANGFRLGDQDAAATARGEAFVATADNASAVYYNPAGITQMTSNNVRSGLYGVHLDVNYRRLNGGNDYDIRKHYAAVPQLFATRTLKDLPLSFGLGIYAPYGGSIHWPETTGFRAYATQGALTYLRINPVVAYRLSPSLSIAAGAMVDYARIDLRQGLNNSTSSLNFFDFSGNGFSVGYNVGLRWQPTEKISLGATFRSETPITFDGRTEFEVKPFIPAATRRNAHMKLTFPLTAVVGISYRPTPKWNLEFDADYTDWSSFGKTSIQQQTPLPYPLSYNTSGSVPVTLNWQASWMYEFGVTRNFDNGWHVSAGYVFDQNSVPDGYYSPLAADLDRHFFSVGTGFKGRRYSLDVTYQFGYGPARTVVGSMPSSAPSGQAGQGLADGTYDFISHAVMLTWGLHF